jgi:hypothetical protein
MPVAKIYATEGQYDDELRPRESLGSCAGFAAGILKVLPDDYFQIIYVLPETGTWTRPLSWV